MAYSAWSTPVDDAIKLERLRKALALARLDFDDMAAKCRDGQYQFHDSLDACAVTTIGVSGGYVTCYVMAVAGDLAGVPELAQRIEDFARAAGCQVIEMDGRAGWGRVYKKLARDYFQVAVKYRKEL